MYKVIIFDFFGVFCAPVASNWFKKAVPDYQAKRAAFQALCTHSDLGKPTFMSDLQKVQSNGQ